MSPSSFRARLEALQAALGALSVDERVFARIEAPASALLTGYTKAVMRSSRATVSGPGAALDGPAVYVIWHRDLPVMMAHHGEHRRWMMMSAAPKMRPIARLAESLGLRLVRGASGERGREALRQLEDVIARGESVLLAVDGPAGPAFVVKPGCVWLARAAGVPVVPTGYRSRVSVRTPLRWDGLRFHTPFEAFRFVYGEPIVVGANEDDEAALVRIRRGLGKGP